MQVYLLLKLLHIIAVIIFLGNITTGLFWMRRADRTGQPAFISFTMEGVIASDRWFTIPGVVIITAGGIAAAIEGGIPLLRTGWIFWSIVLFTLSGIIFMTRVVPLQKKIYSITRMEAEKVDMTLYRSYLKQWEAWGIASLLTPLAAMVMMVLKIPLRSGF